MYGMILIEYNTKLNFLLISLFVVLRLSIWCIEICLVMMTTLEICRYKDISKCVCFGSIRSIFSRERLDGFIDPFNGASSLQPHSVLEIVRSAKKITMYSKIIKKQFCIWFLLGMILGFFKKNPNVGAAPICKVKRWQWSPIQVIVYKLATSFIKWYSWKYWDFIFWGFTSGQAFHATSIDALTFWLRN